MMAESNGHFDDQTLQAPPGLVAALKALPTDRVFISPTLDEAVLRAAQRHLTKRASPAFNWFRPRLWLAATALVVSLLLAAEVVTNSLRHRPRAPAFAREDLNHDGRVDILDAFALARQLKSGAAPGPLFDINGDGVIDERDIATIAARAVKLQKGGHS